MAEYKVLRHHQGDKDYATGDVRTAEPSDVAHLVALGVLEPVGAKDVRPPSNKAEKPVNTKSRG